MKQVRINITKFFTQPNFANIAISVVVGGLLWFLFYNESNSVDSSNVQMLFMKHFVLWTLPLWASKVLGFVAMLGIMVWLMILCERLQIIPVRSAMPLTVGIVMASCVGYIQPFNESYIATFLFILALKQLIKMYHFETQVAAGYNIILLLGVAALFEPTYIWLSLLFVLGMIIFRVITRRVFLSILLGVATLCVITGSLFWLFDSLDIVVEYLHKFLEIALWDNAKNGLEIVNYDLNLTRLDIIVGCFTSALILFTFVGYYFSVSNYKLNTRLNYSFINWGFWISIVWVVIFAGDFSQLIAIPGLFATMCLSLYFSTNQNKMANILFALWFFVFVGYRILGNIELN